MKLSCDCRKFEAEIENLPKETPGRCVCYCDDCQKYMNYLQRSDLLDSACGTEIIPVYPQNFKFVKGEEHLKCLKLYPKGIFRWYASCCSTPIGNVKAKFPWVGIISHTIENSNKDIFEKQFGPVKSRIMGKFACNTPPKGTAAKIDFNGFKVVVPFIIKGIILKKYSPCILFKEDNVTSYKEWELIQKTQ